MAHRQLGLVGHDGATVQPEQRSETERHRFYSGIAKLARSSLAPEELPALLDAQARL